MSEAQVTQKGQALLINSSATSALSSFFQSNIGPKGSLKMLCSPSLTLKLTKDGNTLTKEIQFSHPTTILINKASQSISQILGDGTSSFIVMCCEIFNHSCRLFLEDTNIHRICQGIQTGCTLLLQYLSTLAVPISMDSASINYIDNILYEICSNQLNTKMNKNIAEILVPIVVKSLKCILVSQSESNQKSFLDINMVEVIKMGEGDIKETRLVKGLVLDHGGRHPLMPTYLENVVVMITNLSLEYEKPEINAQFLYSSAEQRDSLVGSERKFIFQRAKCIAEFAKELKTKNKTLMVVSERGIDPISLEVLSNEGVLALRRAKRRNMERLTKMCGGSLISRIEEIKMENMGFCGKVRVENLGEEKFTFIEDVPFGGSCTILVRGCNDFEMERVISGIKSTLKSLSFIIRDKVFIEGGPSLYLKLSKFMESTARNVSEKEVAGCLVLKDVMIKMAKILIKNFDGSVEENIVKVEKGQWERVIDNYIVVNRVIANACVMSVSLLMVDEIIKAGKQLREDNMNGKEGH
ncbi:subunit zeta of T-complex protein 1 [Hamiltosporidium tvaerminnensis]|uniref:Subunit zeta of T-complex protein 1 n=1 Tax=Hamiltosporidium tvaerminnensis TaxID=1176355 RepID=A0A4Q9LC88_9MICR|nr:hypothetical protein LUQ84_001167 [Hamiltosporidium tvaerminnensis]TBU04691.1 subunit zeta of T-complex protein 1 [Hamiltosporidium tvaerminnensis]